MSDYRVDLVPAVQVDAVWHQISDRVENACLETGGDVTSHGMWTECRSGAAYLLIVSRDNQIVAASAWRFEDWSSGRKFRCLFLFGKNMREWFPKFRDALREMKKAGNAQSFVWEGRVGFGRRFRHARVLRQLYEMDDANVW